MKASERRTKSEETMPATGVRTPLLRFTAVCESEPVMGMALG